MTYPEWFFAVLGVGSLIALIGVYAFQVGVFVSDHRAGTLAGDQSVEEEQA